MVCSTAASSPAAPSEITISGQRNPRSPRSVRNACQASVDSALEVASPTKTGLPAVVMPHAASTGSAAAPTW